VTKVRLTFAARCRFPDIGTAIGTTTGSATELGQWHRVEWPGDRTTWLRAEDLEPVTNQPEEPNP
jgi:hypothetical protein